MLGITVLSRYVLFCVCLLCEYRKKKVIIGLLLNENYNNKFIIIVPAYI